MSLRLLTDSKPARQAYLEREGARLERLVREGQDPDVLFIGCSDSRVVAEALTGARPGDLFVVRNVANIVPPPESGEPSVAAALEFAVTRLGIKTIIVCGHTDCGGIRALEADPDSLPARLTDWIQHARPALNRVAVDGADSEHRHECLVEANVLLQMEHVMAYPVVAAAREAGQLRVHGWVFDLRHRRIRYYNKEAGCFETFSDE